MPPSSNCAAGAVGISGSAAVTMMASDGARACQTLCKNRGTSFRRRRCHIAALNRSTGANVMYQMRQNRRLMAAEPVPISSFADLRRQFEQFVVRATAFQGCESRATGPARQSDIFRARPCSNASSSHEFLARHCGRRGKHLTISDTLRAQLFRKSLYTSTIACAHAV